MSIKRRIARLEQQLEDCLPARANYTEEEIKVMRENLLKRILYLHDTGQLQNRIERGLNI